MTPDEIRARRKAAGLTYADVASELGLHTRTIERWETGVTTPSRADLIALDVIFSDQVGAKSAPAPARKSQKR